MQFAGQQERSDQECRSSAAADGFEWPSQKLRERALGSEPLGTRTRRLQRRILRANRSITGRWWLVFHLVIKPLHNLLRIAAQVARIGPRAKRDYGIPIHRQILDQVRLVLFYGAPPWVYYMVELYRPGAMRDVGAFVMRNPMKHGVFKALNRIDPGIPGRRRKLGDKLKAARWCDEANLPHPQPLLVIERADSSWRYGSLDVLDRDLFLKPRHGRGANGVSCFRRVGTFEYLDEHGRAAGLEQLLDRIERDSQHRGLLIQPLLRTHPALADLTGDSLITIRILTCLDEHLRPVVTNAYLRSLAKLEPRWRVGKIDDFASPIDLETGSLGLITGDKAECLSEWSDRHPITGALVPGRIVPFWPELAQLAIKAHGLVAERVFIGWDFAVTETGPVLLEGNSFPDTIFPQRVFRKPIGHMRLGELLNLHLDRLEAKLNRSV